MAFRPPVVLSNPRRALSLLLTLLQRLLSLLGSRDRLTLAGLVALMAVGGLLEGLGIGLLFPYVAILQDPTKIARTPILSMVYEYAGFASYRAFSIAMSVGLLALFMAKALFSLLTSNFQTRFVYGKQVELGQRLLANYLSRPYAFFLNANTSNLIGILDDLLLVSCAAEYCNRRSRSSPKPRSRSASSRFWCS